MANLRDRVDLSAIEHRAVSSALLAYWTSRADAMARSIEKGTQDVGGRIGVTSGGHLDNVAHLIGQACLDAGVPLDHLYYKRPSGVEVPSALRRATSKGVTLPGFFRPTKSWDVVVRPGLSADPIAVIELKSQNGPSYGNNANNRAEEAIGNAYDYRRYLRDQRPPSPWLGYVFLIEDDIRSGVPEVPGEGVGRVDWLFNDIVVEVDRWEGRTYQTRVRDLCRLMVDDGLYDAAWSVTSARPDCPDPSLELARRLPRDRLKCVENIPRPRPHEHDFNWRELEPLSTGFRVFIDSLTERLRNHY